MKYESKKDNTGRDIITNHTKWKVNVTEDKESNEPDVPKQWRNPGEPESAQTNQPLNKNQRYDDDGNIVTIDLIEKHNDGYEMCAVYYSYQPEKPIKYRIDKHDVSNDTTEKRLEPLFLMSTDSLSDAWTHWTMILFVHEQAFSTGFARAINLSDTTLKAIKKEMNVES
jgi:hypothetical protein